MGYAESRFANSISSGELTGQRLLRTLGVALSLALIVTLLSAGRASAVTIYPQIASFGSDGTGSTSFSELRQIAFDQTNNRLYALGAFPSQIYGFDAGTPGAHTPLGGAFPLAVVYPGSGNQSDIAVDNSGLGTAGNIVYESNNNNKVYGFNSAGVLQAGFPAQSPAESSYFSGAGVDPSGNIWVGNYYPQTAEKYSSAGAYLSSVSGIGAGSGHPAHIAFNSGGDMYLTNYFGDTWKLTAASGYSSKTQIDAETAADVEVDRSTGSVYVLRSSNLAVYNSGGTLVATIATSISTNFMGVAIDEGTGVIYLADGNAGKVRAFAPGVEAPVPTTEGTSSLLRNSVTVEGNANPDSAGDITECYFEYGTTTDYGQSKPCSDSLPITSTEGVSADLTGLTTDTTYNYRLVLANANANSRNVGANMTVKTPIAVAGVTTGPASDQTQTSATLNGTFTGDGLNTKYWFEWGPTTSYGTSVSAGPDTSAVGQVTGSADIEGLSVYLPSSQPYHYRLVAENSTGKTFGPDEAFFAAPPFAPGISDTTAEEISSTGARLSAQVNPHEGPTIYRFEYGTDTSYGSATPISQPVGDDTSNHLVTEAIAGLTPGTTYHFRAVAVNFGGTTHGPDQTFSTPDAPDIESSGASSVGMSSALLTAAVSAKASPTIVQFEYGTSPAYGQGTAQVGIGGSLLSRPVESRIDSLTPGTTYHFRAVAVNAIGTVAGPDRSFSTQPTPADGRGSAPKPRKCRKGFVRRRSKCVKKKNRTNRKSTGRHG